MEAIKLDATLETRKSKSGNDYQVVIIKLTPTYEKRVFLESAELELLSISTKSQK